MLFKIIVFKTMLFKCAVICCLFVRCYAAVEGEECTTSEGQSGICIIYNRCAAAIDLVKLGKQPKICGFVGIEPTVCCTDQEPAEASSIQPSGATTTVRPAGTSTLEAESQEEDYKEINEIPTGCAPIPSDLTSARTGQKAFDKCLEYQERFVYPCEKGVTLTTDMHRANHCHHDPDQLFSSTGAVLRNEIPHLAVTVYYDYNDELQINCGASIISENFVLTAAHCLSLVSGTEVTFVVVGISRLEDIRNADNLYKVKRAIPHPKYEKPYHDIALIELDTSIRLSQFVMPACIHMAEPVNESLVLTVSWGAGSNIFKPKQNLQKVILQKMAAHICATRFDVKRLKSGYDPVTQTCYAPTIPNQDSCAGDGGSALLIRSNSVNCMFITIGLSSFGPPCGNVNDPSMYTRVAAYVPWIESIVWP